MISASLKKQILEKLDLLPIEEQRRVLDFTRALTERKTVGIPGRDLLPFAGTIEKAELDSMKRAIENGCERANLNEW